MVVTYFQRRPHGLACHGIERVFATVQSALPEGITPRTVVSRFASRGILRRLYNTAEAAVRQGDVSHITGDVYFLALLMSRSRTIVTYTDLVSLHRLKGIRRTLLRLFWYTLPLRRAGVVTAISEFTKRELVEEFALKPEQVHVIHCPVPRDLCYAPKPFNTALPVLLQVGTGTNKNVARVGRAVAGMPCHLRIIGKLDQATERTLRELHIPFSSVAGLSDEDVAEEYKRCDAVVFASTYEGFGMPIIEAQAVGRPIVTSSVCSMPEVAGDGACLVDPHDVESIRNGILSVVGNGRYRDELVERGRANAERFNAVDIARKYAELYKRIGLRRG